MDALRRFLLRIVATIRPGRVEDELAREVASHLALLEEHFRHEGLSPEAARLAARRAFGGVEQAKEHHRDARAFRWIADLRQDLAYGTRSFARSPGFTAAAAITLALGIGAATTIFGALYGIGLRALPYPDPDRLVRVFEYQPPRDAGAAPRRGHPFAPSQLDVVRQASTLSHVGLWIPRLTVMTAGDTPARVTGGRVSAAIFPMIGAQPILGRGLQDQDERPGSDNVVVISHALWRQHFAARDAAIGETLTLDGRPHIIVGVMPPGFQFPPESTGDIWTPLVPAGTPPTFRLSFYARLRDGVSLAAAQDEIALLYDSARSTTPTTRPRLEVALVKEVLVEPFAPAMTLLAVAVILVLLIACVNVANLVLARSTVRQYEMSLRAALGASRTRLLRQHFAEGLLLVLFSGAGGIAIATIGLWWLRGFAMAGINIPRLSEVGMDVTVAGFAIAISLLAGLSFGSIAGLRQPVSLGTGLRREPRRWPIVGARGVQHALVVAEVAMAVVLFVGSALMIRSFIHLSTIDTGFAAAGVTTFQVTLPPSRPLSELTRVGDALVDRIAAMAPVHGVAYAESLPMVPVGRMAALSTTPAFPKRDPGAPPRLDVRIVSHGYLDVMGIRIAEGRGFSAADGAGAPRALLINETLAREMFAGSSAVGQRIYIGGVPTFDPPGRSSPLAPWEVVGVVADVRQRTVIEPATPQIFVDQRQVPGPTNNSSINVVVRMDGDPAPLLASLRPLIAQLDAAAFVDNVAPLERLVSNTYARPRLYAMVLGIYAVVAIGLAAVGIYGVMAFAVVRRTREIGIRMALGARRRQVQALVIRDSAIVAGAGLVIGIGGAVWSSRLFEGMLFGITPLDRTTYAAVAAAFAAIAMLAAVIPARRASAVDPVLALRTE
jgi:predicted permease